MPYADPFDAYSDGDQISDSGDFVEEDVPNDVGPMEIELNNARDGLLAITHGGQRLAS